MGSFGGQHSMTCNCESCVRQRQYWSMVNQQMLNVQQQEPPEWLVRYMELGTQQYPQPEPTPGDIEHMKQAEPVDDEPPAQIEWKHVNPITRLLRRLRGKDAGE